MFLDHCQKSSEVYIMESGMVLVDGNIRYQANDTEATIRDKICELITGKEWRT